MLSVSVDSMVFAVIMLNWISVRIQETELFDCSNKGHTN